MIYGLIPVGGKGTRLGLPYSKEMLPQKHYDYYNPVINHTVEKMYLAGADKIFMVHGTNYKADIVQYYLKDSRIEHIKQRSPSFAGVLHDFENAALLCKDDKILFGLPDSVYDGNPFVEMLIIPGVVCGLFHGDDTLKVDRPKRNNPQVFDVKTEKSPENMNVFWGVIKFDVHNLKTFSNESKTEKEIGNILTKHYKTYVYGKDYLDLGTWAGYNKYITSSKNFSNTEIEKKYDATNISIEDFNRLFIDINSKYYCVNDSKDYYFTNDNNNIEFIRYRDSGTSDEVRFPNITVKTFNNSQFNRYELEIPVALPKENSNKILEFMSLMGTKFNFVVTVNAYVFETTKYVVVLYNFTLDDTFIQILEIELKEIDYNIISRVEEYLSQNLPGFDPNKTIKQSKFQLIKEYYDKNKS